jgi:hypothetical protein
VEAAAPAPVADEEEEQGEVLGETVSSPRETRTVSAPVAEASAPQAAAAGELPFTGLDTGLVAILGASLLGGGVVLRRRTAPTA